VCSSDLGRNANVINNGTIRADINGQSIEIAIDNFTNNGTVEATNGGSLDFIETTFSLRSGGNAQITNNAVFSITGDTAVNIDGALTNSSQGAIQFDLTNDTPGRLDISGLFQLQGGSFGVEYTGGLDPETPYSFDLISASQITGQFDSLLLPGDETGWKFAVAYSSTAVQLLLTPITQPSAGIWQVDHFGRLGTGPLAGPSQISANVPAPGTVTLLALALPLAQRRRRKVNAA